MAHTSSYYAASAGPIPTRAQLKGGVRADVAIVGGGFTGLSAALDLAKAGYQVVVVEGQQVGWGASGRNGGQMWTGFSKDMDEVEAQVGLDQAKALFPLALEAKALIAERISGFGIDCDFKPGLFEAALKPSHLKDMATGMTIAAQPTAMKLMSWRIKRARKGMSPPRLSRAAMIGEGGICTFKIRPGRPRHVKIWV